MMRIQTILEWWREGENDAKVVYRESYVRFILVFGVSVAILGLIPYFRTWFDYIMCIYLTLGALAERRRAIILNDSYLLYRPIFDPPMRVDLNQIVSVEKCGVYVPSWLTRPKLMNGMRFQLKSGEDVKIPLDLPHSRDISQRFLKSDSH
jgi:hypothetical protein